jgi:hypothetical protein
MPPGTGVASVSTDYVDTLRDKEHTMNRSWVPRALLTLLLGLGLASQTAVANNKTPSRPAKPRVVATVTSLDPGGLP